MADLTIDALGPRLDPPVKRPHFVQPHEAVDVVNGDPDDLFYVRLLLLHGANYNDPAWFDYARVAARGKPCCQACSLEAGGTLPRR